VKLTEIFDLIVLVPNNQRIPRIDQGNVQRTVVFTFEQKLCLILGDLADPAPFRRGGLFDSMMLTVIVEPSTKPISSSESFSLMFWTTRSLTAWVSLRFTAIVILLCRSLADTLSGLPPFQTDTRPVSFYHNIAIRAINTCQFRSSPRLGPEVSVGPEARREVGPRRGGFGLTYFC
jgi:hypothetical protein